MQCQQCRSRLPLVDGIGLSYNRFVVDGELVDLGGLRFTPAGLARVELKIRHSSMQQEAGMPRQVQCEIPALALDAAARQASNLRLGQVIKAEGFLAQRSLRNTQLVMHIDNITLK